MTDEQRVKEKLPHAHCWVVLVAPWLWQVQPREGYKDEAIGEGPTELLAWYDAASRLESEEKG